MIDKKISVIIPCYNEEGNILNMYERLIKVLNPITNNYELVFINNGSTDNSYKIFDYLTERDPKVTVIELSRNFGSSQPAYTCGLEYVTGDCAVLIDGDIQDPPELIPNMITKWLEGYDVVYGIRKKRKGSLIRRIGYKIFYRMLKKLAYIDIPLDAGDFSLIDRKVIDALNLLPERNRFIRGLRAWVGFKSIGIEYTREDRKAGKTSNSFMDNIRWAKMGIFSFSYYPLELISYIAFIVMLISLIGICVYIISYFVYPNAPRGFSTLIVAILFLGAVQLLSLSIIGEYLGKIFEETKGRPIYIIKRIINDHRKAQIDK
ncbi:MAG: glycosyltransferase family 2 protein [Tepidanaerobacteraceae bacterium]|jgi:dolichol-phosphate mannosyltransferase|nr:glycosyltransferase family 2 protein [Tepidanaerobacteraceae bacterium]